MSTSPELRQIIIEYWSRIFLCLSIHIQDIAKIMVEYGDETEEFVPSISSKEMKFDNSNLTVYYHGNGDGEWVNAYGMIEAYPGCTYHWKLKLIEEDTEPNIGIIESTKHKESASTDNGWWNESFGYSLFQDGDIYHHEHWGPYAVAIGKNDIVDIFLDLKENYEISFAVNDKKYGKAYDVNKETNYRLAIGLYNGKISLISFEISY